jgi:ribosomal protein L32
MQVLGTRLALWRLSLVDPVDRSPCHMAGRRMTRGIPGPDPYADTPERRARAAAIRATRRDYTAAERAHGDANPYQRCPDCGREEASHTYCSGCLRAVDPAEWLPTLLGPEALDNKRAALRRVAAARSASAPSVASRGGDTAPATA